MALDRWVVERFHRVLVEEIRRDRPEYLEAPFTVAEIYQSLVPYRTHRDRIGVELNGDYEEALLALLAGDAGYLDLESQAARERIRRELASPNPNTGVYREFAAVTVRLNRDRLAALPETEERPPATSPAVSPAASTDQDPVAARSAAGGAETLTGSSAPAPSSVPGKEGKGGTAPAPSGISEETPVASKAPVRAPSASDPVVRARTTVAKDASTAARPVHCPECSSDLPDRANLRFCPFCGVDVFTTSCTACGEELDRRWSFCIACGTPAPAGATG